MNVWQGEFPGKNTCADGFLGTCPVGTYPANGWGLFEMTGNEWTADWFAVDHCRTAVAAVNPKGPKRGVRKVARGGS